MVLEIIQVVAYNGFMEAVVLEMVDVESVRKALVFALEKEIVTQTEVAKGSGTNQSFVHRLARKVTTNPRDGERVQRIGMFLRQKTRRLRVLGPSDDKGNGASSTPQGPPPIYPDMQCPVCGRWVPGPAQGMNACGVCKADLAIVCPHCDELIALSAVFCSKCGKSVAEADPLKDIADGQCRP